MYSQVPGEHVDPPGNDYKHDYPPSADVQSGVGAPTEPVASSADIGADEDVAAAAPLPEETTPASARRLTPVMSLLAEIARAMQVAADQERDRIAVSVSEDEATQIEKIRLRAAAEADELEKHAEEDVILIDAWREDQMRRIREDADRQIDDRRSRLEESLTHHGSLIEAEIQSVQVAVKDYRASLDAFFGRLSEERQPSAIARLAGTLPDPPDLQEVRADARSGAMKDLEQRSAADGAHPAAQNIATGEDGSEPARDLVGVMEPRVTERSAGVGQTEAVPSAHFAAPPPWSRTRSDIGSTEAPPDDLPSEGNVAVRLIRSLTGRTSQADGSGDR
jgi:hypothetical protein